MFATTSRIYIISSEYCPGGLLLFRSRRSPVRPLQFVTLTSDFAGSHYQGILEGLVASQNPWVRVLTLTRELPPRDVQGAAFLLRRALPRFPPAVHLVLVSAPSEGPSRTLVVACDRGILVGPDNGVLMPAARDLGIGAAYEVSTPRYGLSTPFNTLLAVEMYATLAASLSGGLPPHRVGPQVTDWAEFALPSCRATEDGLDGQVLLVDVYGSLLTNIPAAQVARLAEYGDWLEVELAGERRRVRLSKRPDTARPDDVVAVMGGNDLLELTSPSGSAAQRLGATGGTAVRVRPVAVPSTFSRASW